MGCVASTAAPTTLPERRFEQKPRVAVVGDDEVARRRICEAIPADRLELVADAGSSDTVIVADLGPRLAAEGEIRALRERLPGAHVVVVSGDERNGAVQAALRAGAAGFVRLGSLPDALVACVQAVVNGMLAVPHKERSTLGQRALTSREKQTLALVVMGFTNGEIAGRLYLAESTVKSHLSSAFNKLGVRSRNEAAELILDPASGVGPGILTIPSEQ